MVEQKPQEAQKKYTPERPYKERKYKTYGKGFADLCGNCKHYYKNINELGLTETEFPVKCQGHINDTIAWIEEDDFDDPEEYDDVLIMHDPVAWAYSKFGWQARWYQQDMQSCTAQKKVVRAGRRIGKSENIVMHMLWLTNVNSNFTVLVVAPYQAQVTLLFDALNKFLALSSELSGSIARNTKNPHRIEFNNGSKLLGFSSGSKSAARSDKIRGQDANYIVLDEADYLADDDLEAILAILASHPECGLWASSTPTGLHGKFYQWCVQKQLGFKEFHYISAESPSWTQETEEFYKQDYDIVKFEHEFLAEFGIQVKGVFRNDLVDDALDNYSLPRQPSPGSRVMMGVDWNGSDIGVHITVVEWDGEHYVLLDKIIIKTTEFTQHSAIDRIIALNAQYNPAFIYVDKGYGEVQVEMLHKHGMNNRNTGLHKKVVAYSFGEQIELIEPKTSQIIKKPAKPFMVNTCAIQLEEGRLTLPISEDTQVLAATAKDKETGKGQGLVQQMRNYQVLRYSTLGLPTYSQGEDHTLVAYMLCIVGFILEFSDMRSLNIATSVYYNAPSLEDSREDRLAQITRSLGPENESLNSTDALMSMLGGQKHTESLRNKMLKNGNAARSKYFSAKRISRNSSLGGHPGSSGRSRL